MLTDAQLPTLKSAIDTETDPAFVALRTSGATGAMAEWFNAPHASFWVWKTVISEHEITRETAIHTDGTPTTWSWPAFIVRSQGERDGWARMFNGTYTINPSLPQVRQGIADIFSNGPTGAAAQRNHLLAICRRLATRGERLFATGNGTVAVPGLLGFEGAISDYDVIRALGA